MKHTFRIMLLAIALLSAAVPAFAQTAAPTPILGSIELKGPIEAVGTGTITLGGQAIDIRGAFVDDDVRLVAGATVEVHVQPTPVNGTWLALSVDNERDPLTAPFAEIKGTLDSINGMTIIVSGAVVDISSASIADALVVGMPVEVYATPGMNGTWVASRVEENFRDRDRDQVRNDDGSGRGSDDDPERERDRDRFHQGEDFEIVGTVEQAGADFLVVNGQRISIASGVTDLDPFVVGDRVAVEIGMVNGAPVAFEVNNLRGDDSLDDRGGNRGSGDDRGGRGSDDRGGSSGSGRGSDDRGGSSGSGGGDDHGGSSGSGGGSDDRGGSSGSGGGSDDRGGSSGSGGGDDHGGSSGSGGGDDHGGGSGDD